MSKAFVRENDSEDEQDAAEAESALPDGTKNYITPVGYQRLKDELLHLIDDERPEVVRTVSWAASNGDRSENGDYIYGKRRLREIDRRIRFLTRRLDTAVPVDPALQPNREQIFFGATVHFRRNGADVEEQVTIVGVDEVDPLNGLVSWVSPIARVLIKSRVGDALSLRTPAGVDRIEVVEIGYPMPVA